LSGAPPCGILAVARSPDSDPHGAAMLLVPYQPDELHFAFCYHAYLRWGTRCRQPSPALARLDRLTLQPLVERYHIHVLGCEAAPTEVRALVSLRPEEALSACASKLKGQVSKWLRAAGPPEEQARSLGRGYFACTSGGSEREQVERYLEGQGEHHGYAGRVLPPVHVASFPLSAEGEARLRAQHAWAVPQFHLVLATWRRRGTFGPEEARAVTACWRALEPEERFAVLKVSFVPDHVHVAVRTHPGVAPARLVVALLNAAQELLWERFAAAVIRAGLERLWQPSAYVGSFGDLATAKIQQYLRNWSAGRNED
jgi:REP element-mobilizing transposase RayT